MVDKKNIPIFDSLNRKDMYKKKQVIILKGTKDAKNGEIVKSINGYFIATTEPISLKPYYIYVLSDEPIKEGDWCYHPQISDEFTIIKNGDIHNPEKGLHPSQGVFQWKNTSNEWYQQAKKIIATNNPVLNMGWIRDNDPLRLNPEYVNITTMNGVPNISTGFIQQYLERQNSHFPMNHYMVEYGYTIDKSLGHFHQQRKYFLKVNETNTIKIIEEQRSWNRDQVIEIARQAFNQGEMNEGDVTESYRSFDDLIEEIL